MKKKRDEINSHEFNVKEYDLNENDVNESDTDEENHTFIQDLEKRKWPKRVVIGLVIFFAAFGILSLSDKEGKDKDKSQITLASINTLIGGGNFYSGKDRVLIQPTADCKGMQMTNKGDTQTFSNSLCSYVNVQDDVAYYRKDSDRGIYKMTLGDGKETPFYTGNAGEIFQYKNYVYFIDLNHNSNLMRLRKDEDTEPEIIVKDPVEKFAIYGNECFYLTENNDLSHVELKKGQTPISFPDKYNEFFFYENEKIIVARSGNRIISFKINGKNPQLLYESKKGNIKLAGAGKDKCYILKSGKLKGIPIDKDSKEETFKVDAGKLITSICETENGTKGIVYKEDGMNVNMQVVDIQ
ncbi:DUF5050 domain-containing protein [Novisyntrophococcus fermenticellae]|uniref:DUF5050 domain-containing protein n=1 Tax=Novisyntrophococcus fermenticellae TaxID=2068655 RepID=UPI001E2CB500|nr:DUF5050 domain-containing protein [Novisyntrophococcus fermenticellae]